MKAPNKQTSTIAAIDLKIRLMDYLLWCIFGTLCFMFYPAVGYVSSLQGVDYAPYLIIPLDTWIPFQTPLIVFYYISDIVPLIVTICLLYKFGLDATPLKLSFDLNCLLLTNYLLYILFPVSIELLLIDNLKGAFNRRCCVWYFNSRIILSTSSHQIQSHPIQVPILISYMETPFHSGLPPPIQHFTTFICIILSRLLEKQSLKTN
jgi:hypothetical protein